MSDEKIEVPAVKIPEVLAARAESDLLAAAVLLRKHGDYGIGEMCQETAEAFSEYDSKGGPE